MCIAAIPPKPGRTRDDGGEGRHTSEPVVPLNFATLSFSGVVEYLQDCIASSVLRASIAASARGSTCDKGATKLRRVHRRAAPAKVLPASIFKSEDQLLERSECELRKGLACKIHQALG